MSKKKSIQLSMALLTKIKYREETYEIIKDMTFEERMEYVEKEAAIVIA